MLVPNLDASTGLAVVNPVPKLVPCPVRPDLIRISTMASFSMSVQTAKALIDATAWKARSHSVSYGAIPNLSTNLPQSPHHQSVSADQRGGGGRMADASGVFSGGCRVDLGVPLSGRDGGLECQGHDQEQTGEPVGKLVSVKISCVTSVTSLTTAGCSTQQIATCSGRAAAQHSAFKWVNSVRGNFKSAITGTYGATCPRTGGAASGVFRRLHFERTEQFQSD